MHELEDPAAHFHFQSKQGLLNAVLKRRIDPINEEGLRLLDDLEAQPGEAGPGIWAGVSGAGEPGISGKRLICPYLKFLFLSLTSVIDFRSIYFGSAYRHLAAEDRFSSKPIDPSHLG